MECLTSVISLRKTRQIRELRRRLPNNQRLDVLEMEVQVVSVKTEKLSCLWLSEKLKYLKRSQLGLLTNQIC